MGLASLYEQVARAIYEDRGPSVLRPAQWSALRFFGRAGIDARTVTGLANFMGTTLGPASRAAAALERRGLIQSKQNPNDQRSTLFDLTDDGQLHLDSDPLFRLAGSLSLVEETDQEVFRRVVIQLAEDLGARKD